ncbi:MAG: hypothetical protein GY856_37265 [bacterium]|nr:hypothetical protein [bacterium]
MNRKPLGLEKDRRDSVNLGRLVLPICLLGMIIVMLVATHLAVTPASIEEQPDLSDLAELVVEAMVGHSFQEAHALAQRLAEAEPDNARALALLGLAELKAGRYPAAEVSLWRALALDSACPEAHLGMGHLAFGRNDLETASDHFERATASHVLYEEAYRALRIAYLDHGDLAGARRTVRAHEARLRTEGRPINARLAGRRAFLEMVDRDRVLRIPEGFEGTSVELTDREGPGEVKMLRIGLNDQGETLFHIDSAFRGMMALSPDLADELGLERAGESVSRGVGPQSPTTQGAWLDTVRIGDLTIEDVPILVIDSAIYRGKKRGLIGTGLLKQFNATLDVRKDVLELFPKDRSDEFRRRIPSERIAQSVPFLIYPAPIVLARVGDGRPLPFTVDTAASSSLIDEEFFNAQLRPSIPDEELATSMVTGAGGTQRLVCWTAARLGIGDLAFSDMRMISFDMHRLNVLSGRYAAGVLSNDFMWGYRAHFDFARTVLILESYE